MNTLALIASPMLAAAKIEVGGDGFLNQLVTFLIVGLCVGLLYAAAYYFASRPKAPPIAMTVVNGLFIILGVLAIINFLLGLTGNQFIKW